MLDQQPEGRHSRRMSESREDREGRVSFHASELSDGITVVNKPSIISDATCGGCWSSAFAYLQSRQIGKQDRRQLGVQNWRLSVREGSAAVGSAWD